MIASVLLSILWFAIWLILSWPPHTWQIVTGLFASIFVTFMTGDLFMREEGNGGISVKGLIKLPARLFWFLVYTAVFIWECVKANIDVASVVVRPSLPIRPGTIRVKTDLTSDMALTFLANSMTLTPGTTAIDIDKDKGCLYIHWLCVKEADGKPCRLPVVQRYEWLLKRIFE